MPGRFIERQSLEVELAELKVDIASYQAELNALPLDAKAQREMRTWHIQRARRRLAELEARLASIPATER